MLIALPNSYAQNTLPSTACWADNRDNLLTDTCFTTYINGSYYIQANNISIDKNEKNIGINAVINNPIQPGNYSFTVNFVINNFTYATTNPDYLVITDISILSISSLELVNLPK